MTRQSIINSFRQAIAAGDRNKLSKTDFDELIDDFVEQLAELKSKAKIKALCAAELALLEEGYPQATIAKVYLPRYRKAIKEATEDGFLPLTKATSYQYDYAKRNSGEEGTAIDHFALLYLKYDQALYSQLANASADRNNQKQDNLCPVNLEAFLGVVAILLQSTNPFDLAAGIAAATGRRFSEVVAKGDFVKADKDPQSFWLSFGGQLKKKSVADRFRTPALFPATIVLKALKRFRSLPRIAKLAESSPDLINRSLADSVNRSVDRHFADLVPVLPGETAVTIHNLRAIYGEICTHYFCPPDRTTARFVQECLGHVISEQELRRANSAATQHYFHYFLVDSAGKHLSAKGIKLETEAPPVIEPIPQPPTPIAPPSPPPPKTPSTDLGVITYRLNNLESAVTNIATLLQQQSALLQNLMISTSAQPPKISKAQGKIRRAIAVALDWNNAQPQKFAVTQTLIQKATGSNMPAVRSVFEDPAIQSLIADHHRAIGFENNLKQPKNTLAILNWIQEQLADFQ
jgi:Telomere resolvase